MTVEDAQAVGRMRAHMLAVQADLAEALSLLQSAQPAASAPHIRSEWARRRKRLMATVEARRKARR